MNKKGFTLIELLAVIVILAIIALITAPIILGVIENARKDSAKDKAWGTINAVELAYAQDQTKEGSYKIGTSVDFSKKPTSVGSVQVKASGELPESGTVTIRDDGQIIAQNLKFGNYTCSTVKSETDSTIDPNNMVCVKNDGHTVTPTSNVVYRYTGDDLYIGDSIEGITTVTDYNTLGKNHFLKHTIKEGKIESAEACFIKDGNTYCLKPNEFETSKTKLLEILGEGACNVGDAHALCYASGVGVYARARSNGYVNASDASSGCIVSSVGNSHCGVDSWPF